MPPGLPLYIGDDDSSIITARINELKENEIRDIKLKMFKNHNKPNWRRHIIVYVTKFNYFTGKQASSWLLYAPDIFHRHKSFSNFYQDQNREAKY